MGLGLYTLRRRAVMVIVPNGKREPAYFLQLAVEHALSQDSQTLVDAAVRYACREWQGQRAIPRLVVQVGGDGVPRADSPIFEWSFHSRTYCFEHELPPEIGFLGERELRGYTFRTAKDGACFTAFKGSRKFDESEAEMHKSFWSEEDLFRCHGQYTGDLNRKGALHGDPKRPLSFRLTKILGLIRLIENKGDRASAADLSFLGCLKEKASQLGCSS